MPTNTKQLRPRREGAPHISSSSRPVPHRVNRNLASGTLTPLFLKRQPAGDEALIQTKLLIGKPNDEYEQEADDVADQVMRMSNSDIEASPDDEKKPDLSPRLNTPIYLQRKPGKYEEEHSPATQTRPVQAKTKTASSQCRGSVSQVLSASTGGKSLSAQVRNRVEPVLGQSMEHVRVHDDTQANEAASAINARAFTHQHDIYLGQGESENDVHLMAHEVTHVVQQNKTSTPRISRATQRRETRPSPITRAGIETEVAKSYWKTKLDAIFSMTYISPVTNRFKSSKEERDAVLSVLWQNKPGPRFNSTITRLFTISARSGVKGAKDLLYQFVFKPKSRKTKASVEIQLVAEDSATKITAAATPTSAYTASPLALNHMGFPKNDMDAYFKSNPDEHKQLYNWLENMAPAKFDQVITTAVSKTNKTRTTTRNASFKVKGSKSSSTGISGLVINFLGALLPGTATPSSGYHDKTYVDIELEQLQSKRNNKLGTITGLSSLPKDEISSVKYTIWQYFEFGKVARSELDVIIPIANSIRSVYYTLRFDTKTNDVEVERIGEAGKAKVKPDELDISRVQGFSTHSKDVTTFSGWLKKRYPGVSVTGKTLVELQASFNKALLSGCGKPDWFTKNYGIEILDATTGDTRMDKIHNWPTARRTAIKDYSSSELVKLEMTLQTMSLPVLKHLKLLRLVRQDNFLKKKNNVYVAVAKTYGYTVNNGSDTTVLMFDSFNNSDNNLFAGGKQGVRSSSIGNFAHELGHAIDYSAGGIARKFNAFVKKEKIRPMSWYAATGKSEEFPEAFAFYHSDPEWMKTNLPKMFTWFETLTTTGKPP